MKRRIKNIIKRLVDGDDFYMNCSPKITRSEIDEIETLTGQLLQVENLYGAEAGSPKIVYPIFRDKFLASAIKLLGED